MAENEEKKHNHEEEEGAKPLNISSEEAAEQEPEAAVQQPEAEAAANEALAGALKSSFTFLKWAMIGVVIIYVATGITWIAPDEVAFKLAFGRVISVGDRLVLRPGTVHLRWPWEEIQRVRTDEQVLPLEQEFWAARPGGDPRVRQADSLAVRDDGYLLTGDANIVHMKMRVRYSVRDDSEGAVAYKFYVEDAQEILRRSAMSAATKVVGAMPVMDVINRRGLFEQITHELRAGLDAFEEDSGTPLGIEVISVEAIERAGVKNPGEPGAVRSAFFRAQNAANERDSLVQEGETEATNIRSSARATAAEIRARARAYATHMVNAARADANQMEQLLPIYEETGEQAAILLNDFYARAIVDVMEDSPGAFVLHEPSDGGTRELRVRLTRQPVTSDEGVAAQQE